MHLCDFYGNLRMGFASVIATVRNVSKQQLLQNYP